MNAYAPVTPLAAPTGPVPAQLATLDRQRMKDYQSNLDFYAGRQWPVQRRNIRARRLTFNYARTIVDKTASFLLNGVSFAIDPEGPNDVDRAARREAALSAIIEANDLEALDYDSMTTRTGRLEIDVSGGLLHEGSEDCKYYIGREKVTYAWMRARRASPFDCAARAMAGSGLFLGPRCGEPLVHDLCIGRHLVK
jgi:hypothetical protein